MIAAETVPSLLGVTAAKISKAAPPCWPLKSASMAERCVAVAFLSTMWRAFPLPSCTGPGNHKTLAKTTPSRDVSPKWPFSIRQATRASQRPVVGSALNWQGHPQAQLQLAISSPDILQDVVAMSHLLSDVLSLRPDFSRGGAWSLLAAVGCKPC